MEEKVIKPTFISKVRIFLKKRWLIVVLSLIVMLLFVLRTLAPPLPPPPEPALPTPTLELQPTLLPDPFKINQFWQVLIGQPKEVLFEELGQPVKTETLENRTVYSFSSETENWPNLVFMTLDGKAVYFIKRFFPDKKETFSGFIKKYGSYTKNYFGPDSQVGFFLYTFDWQGITLMASPTSDLILQVWYYLPGDKDAIFNINPDEITETQPKVF